MKLSVDKNAYSAFVKGQAPFVEFIQVAELLAISVIVLGELHAGFRNGTRREANELILRRTLSSNRVRILHRTENTSEIYADIWCELQAIGRPIPTNDIWIAAQCRERGYSLLTRDALFAYIPGLQVVGLGA